MTTEPPTVKPTLCALLAALVLAAPTAAVAEEGIASLASRFPVPETVARVRIALE